MAAILKRAMKWKGMTVLAPRESWQTFAEQTQSGGIICRNQMLMMCLDYAQQLPVKNGTDASAGGTITISGDTHLGWVSLLLWCKGLGLQEGFENVPGDMGAAWRRILFKWRIIMVDAGWLQDSLVMMRLVKSANCCWRAWQPRYNHSVCPAGSWQPNQGHPAAAAYCGSPSRATSQSASAYDNSFV